MGSIPLPELFMFNKGYLPPWKSCHLDNHCLFCPKGAMQAISAHDLPLALILRSTQRKRKSHRKSCGYFTSGLMSPSAQLSNMTVCSARENLFHFYVLLCIFNNYQSLYMRYRYKQTIWTIFSLRRKRWKTTINCVKVLESSSNQATSRECPLFMEHIIWNLIGFLRWWWEGGREIGWFWVLFLFFSPLVFVFGLDKGHTVSSWLHGRRTLSNKKETNKNVCLCPMAITTALRIRHRRVISVVDFSNNPHCFPLFCIISCNYGKWNQNMLRWLIHLPKCLLRSWSYQKCSGRSFVNLQPWFIMKILETSTKAYLQIRPQHPGRKFLFTGGGSHRSSLLFLFLEGKEHLATQNDSSHR